MSALDRLQALGLVLPAPTSPAGSYTSWRRSGNLLHLSGHVCKRDSKVISGKVGPGGQYATAEAAKLAELAALELLSTIHAAVGLDQIARVLKLTGFVNSTPDFTEQPTVMNGASELLVAVLGPEVGTHARSAVGVAQLPFGAAVEIDAIVELRTDPPARMDVDNSA